MGFDECGANPRWVNVVTFRLGEYACGMPIESIVKILNVVKITPIPELKGEIEGIIEVDGGVVPVISLRQYFSLPGLPFHIESPIIVATTGGNKIGLVVDQVLDVVFQPSSDISQQGDTVPPEFGMMPLLKGVVQSDGGPVYLLAPDCLYTPRQISLFMARVGEYASHTFDQARDC